LVTSVNLNVVQGEIAPHILNEVSSEQKTKVYVEIINGEDIQEINLELDESHQEEEDDDSSKQEKFGSECQQEDEKDEDKEYYDEILGEE
jgi:hypothetical protein